MSEQQVQTLGNVIMVVAFGAIGIGVVLSLCYLSSLRRFISLFREREQSSKSGGLGIPKGLADISPLGAWHIAKVVLSRASFFSGETEEARLTAKRRLLILIAYFTFIIIAIVVGTVTVGIIVAR